MVVVVVEHLATEYLALLVVTWWEVMMAWTWYVYCVF